MDSKYENTTMIQSISENKIKSAFKQTGFGQFEKISKTLQGSIWRCMHISTNINMVIKVTERKLHSQSVIVCDGKKYSIHEDIVKEKNILKYLSVDKNAPNSIVKYVAFFKTNTNYFLVMNDAGYSLFDFMAKAHKLIEAGKINIFEWHKVLKIILIQMIQSIEYIHSKNVCHFDISLENFVINDVDVHLTNDGKVRFCTKDIQVRLCDFGLSEKFKNNADFRSNKYCGKSNYQCPDLVKQTTFDAKQNDIWCLGVSIFMLLIGGSPWLQASDSDKRFVELIKNNGIKNALIHWNRLEYVNDDLIDLLKLIFQCEGKKVTIDRIKQSPFLR